MDHLNHSGHDNEFGFDRRNGVPTPIPETKSKSGMILNLFYPDTIIDKRTAGDPHAAV
jgi:hypothetical protein